MKLSGQQKACVGVLGVAMVALIADRTVFQPREAAAESIADLAAHGSQSGAASVAESPAKLLNAGRGQPISARLKHIAKTASLDKAAQRDAFAVPWEVAEPPPVAETVEPEIDVAQQFVSSHQLTAVMGSGSNGGGVFDGKYLAVGAMLDGFTLESIGSRSAIFVSGTKRAELALSAPADRADEDDGTDSKP